MGSFKILVSLRKHRVGVGSNRNKMRSSSIAAGGFLDSACGSEKWEFVWIGSDLLALFELRCFLIISCSVPLTIARLLRGLACLLFASASPAGCSTRNMGSIRIACNSLKTKDWPRSYPKHFCGVAFSIFLLWGGFGQADGWSGCGCFRAPCSPTNPTNPTKTQTQYGRVVNPPPYVPD
jgi:hypothetical protein